MLALVYQVLATVSHSLLSSRLVLLADRRARFSTAPVTGTADACDALCDACLAVFSALPERAAALPADAQELRGYATWFDEQPPSLGQHLFNVELWNDALEALARAVTTTDASLMAEVADAVLASANFVELRPKEQQQALDTLAAVVLSAEFLTARQAALATTRQRRTAKPESEASAYAAARSRRRAQDYVAVPPTLEDDEAIIGALYACAVQQLAAPLLRPLGFPPSQLGVRSLVASARAAGSQRAAAAFGWIWHAADEPGPLIVRTPFVIAAAASVASAHTLVIVFSSLGWHGVVRAEYGSTLRAAGDDRIVIAHALDTAQSWFTTDPTSGEYDDGAWWDQKLAEICAPYERVCILGESMGASAALRFSRHATATGSVVALVPQVDVSDFEYAGARADFSTERKARLRDAIGAACRQTAAKVVLHVGRDEADLAQLVYLHAEGSTEGERLRVTRHDVPGHALGAGLKARGLLRRTVLRDLLGHSYALPASACASVSL
jgi:hypothetical protein